MSASGVVEKYAIPAKPPKYMSALNIYLDTSAPVSRRATNKAVFDQINSAWPEFRKVYRKAPPAKKTPEQKAAAQKARLSKTLAQPALWDAVLQSSEVVPALKRAAIEQKHALSATPKDQQRHAAKKRRRGDESDEEEAEGGDLDDDNDNDDDEMVDSGQASDGEESGGEEVDEEAEEAGDAGDDDIDEKEIAAKLGDDDQDDYDDEDRDAATSKMPDVPVKMQTRLQLRRETDKQVPIAAINAVQTRLYAAISEYKIGIDGEVAKLVDQLCQMNIMQSKALGNVREIIKE